MKVAVTSEAASHSDGSYSPVILEDQSQEGSNTFVQEYLSQEALSPEVQ